MYSQQGLLMYKKGPSAQLLQNESFAGAGWCRFDRRSKHIQMTTWFFWMSPGSSPLIYLINVIDSQHINTTSYVWVQLYSPAVTLRALQLQSFTVTPCCLGLPAPCRRPVRRPGDLWSLTCKRPAGCPVVRGSQMACRHLDPARGRDRLDRRSHRVPSVHHGLSINTQRWGEIFCTSQHAKTTGQSFWTWIEETLEASDLWPGLLVLLRGTGPLPCRRLPHGCGLLYASPDGQRSLGLASGRLSPLASLRVTSQSYIITWTKRLKRSAQLEYEAYSQVRWWVWINTSQGQRSSHYSSSGSSSQASPGHPSHPSSASGGSSSHQSPDGPAQPGLNVALAQALLQALIQVIQTQLGQSEVRLTRQALIK